MPHREWEERSLNFLTEMASTPVGKYVWNRFRVEDAFEFRLLRNEIRRALFANEETINGEDQILINNIAQCCTDNSHHKKVIVDIAVVYVCVRIEEPTSEHIIPIFRLRNWSREPKDCKVIDHLGKLYTDLASYLKDNTWGPSRLRIPSHGQYNLDENGKCESRIHVQVSTVNEKANINTIKEIFHKTSVIELTKKIFASITSAQKAQEVVKAKQQKELSSEHRSAYNALCIGYHESERPGEVRKMHGDRKFIRDMRLLKNLDKYYENFIIKADGNFHINEVLTIHPRAYAQLPEDAKATIIEATKQLKNNGILNQDIEKRVQAICKVYRIRFVKQTAYYKDKLVNKFEVNNLEDVRVGNQHIFVNLKPSEIDRLHQVISDSLGNDTEYVKLGKNFATKMAATNLTEYIAASEYIVRRVREECKVRQRQNRNPVNRGKKKVGDFYKEQVINELQENDFEDVEKSFLELMTVCDIAMKGMNPRFKNLFTAANHYDKHKILSEFDRFDSVSPKTYFEIARKMTSAAYSEVHWTQDGSALVCTYLSELRTKAIKFVTYPDKTRIIATVFDCGKNNEIVPSNYHYHPDF